MIKQSDTGSQKPDSNPSISERLSVLLLCDDYGGHANTVLDHIEALLKFSQHDVRSFNPIGLPRCKYLNLDEFDVVVIHYSVKIISEEVLPQALREKIRRYQGLKVLFIQDEYRQVDQFTEMMKYLAIHVLFTLMAEPDIPKLYSEARLPGVVKLTTLAGFVPESLVGIPTIPLVSRPLDIGYRGRDIPWWLGILGQEKAWIGQGVLARASKYGLRCDIAWNEASRIYGQKWIEFLGSCKATLGTESGASITDFDGSIERNTKVYLIEHPAATFEDVHREVLAPYENNVRVTAISPRIFEAAVLRTAMILFPGTYSGAIQPWTHYIPLAKDFSNLDEVVERLRDIGSLKAMTERAHHDLVASGNYSQRSFALHFDETISRYGAKACGRWKLGYRLACLQRPMAAARKQTLAAAQPIMSTRQMAVNAALSLLLVLRKRAGWQVLQHILGNPELRHGIKFRDLLRDILKLAVIGQTLGGRPTGKKPFRITVSIDPERGLVMFQSLPCGERGVANSRTNTTPNEEPSTQHQWDALVTALRDQRIRVIVWDHTALGGMVRYVFAGIWGFPVCVGDYDMHSFDGFVELVHRAPDTAEALFRPLVQAELPV